MANLTEEDIWETGIYQIEASDPVLGGAPNITTKSGLVNIPASQIANRLTWLKNRVDKFGDFTIVVTDIDAIDKSGTYSFVANTTNSPIAANDGRILHVQDEDGEASQIAIMDATSVFFRDKNSASSAWGGWKEFIHSGNISDELKPQRFIYETTNGPDSWITNENIAGDTSLSFLSASVYISRVKHVAEICLRLEVGGFSMDVPNDNSLSFTFDLGALAQSVGAFQNVSRDGFFISGLRFSGDGKDFQFINVHTRLDNYSKTYPNTLTFSITDMTNIGQDGTPTSFNVYAQFTATVED